MELKGLGKILALTYTLGSNPVFSQETMDSVAPVASYSSSPDSCGLLVRNLTPLSVLFNNGLDRKGEDVYDLDNISSDFKSSAELSGFGFLQSRNCLDDLGISNIENTQVSGYGIAVTSGTDCHKINNYEFPLFEGLYSQKTSGMISNFNLGDDLCIFFEYVPKFEVNSTPLS